MIKTCRACGLEKETYTGYYAVLKIGRYYYGPDCKVCVLKKSKIRQLDKQKEEANAQDV